MKNRILGITVLLAVVVVGLAFMSCPQDTEDREIVFTNKCGIAINVITDGTPASLPLAAASSKTGPFPKDTVKKTGSDIKLVNVIAVTAGEVNADWTRYIDIDFSGISSVSTGKDGSYSFGSGSVILSPKTLDNGSPWGAAGNPAAIP